MQSKARPDTSATTPHVQGVNATSSGLVKATLGAAVAAAAILTFVWLPAEYGIDPTGAGRMLGLTEMGQIKEQLHAEAEAEATSAVQTTKGVQPDQGNSDISQKLDAIQRQLTAIAATVGSTSEAASTQTLSQPLAQTGNSAAEPAVSWRDEVENTLQPGEGIEVKLVMDEGAVAEFEWSANGAVVNHDTHGDGEGQSISYKQGRSVPEEAGQLVAAFTGNHGWYWRNRTDAPVVVTLRTRGDYKEML
jgi:hypothetical protein